MSGYNPERAKARRDERRRHGICTTCGKHPAFANYASCEYCIEKRTVRSAKWRERNRDKINQRQRARQRRDVAAGICPSCRQPNPDQSRVWCPKCRAKDHARFMRKYVHKIRPDGVCLRCDRPVEPGWKLCPVHREYAAAAGEKGRAAQDRSRHPWRLDEDARRAALQHF